jgi:hypothetical protein
MLVHAGPLHTVGEMVQLPLDKVPGRTQCVDGLKVAVWIASYSELTSNFESNGNVYLFIYLFVVYLMMLSVAQTV